MQPHDVMGLRSLEPWGSRRLYVVSLRRGTSSVNSRSTRIQTYNTQRGADSFTVCTAKGSLLTQDWLKKDDASACIPAMGSGLGVEKHEHRQTGRQTDTDIDI